MFFLAHVRAWSYFCRIGRGSNESSDEPILSVSVRLNELLCPIVLAFLNVMMVNECCSVIQMYYMIHSSHPLSLEAR